MHVREVTESDVHKVVPLFDQYRMFYQQFSDEEGAHAFLEERIRKAESVMYVAEDEDGEASGFVQLYPSFSSVSMKRLWILNDLYVTEQARGKGVGVALLEKAKELAIETKAKGLMLQTAEDNVRAQGIYEEFGFKQEKDRFYVLFL
ncbi:GNAT family N-acetyltransferase [Priestia taiwanensis]|uniref:N-acetyltransferase n=1 Tax=Priestia taiwanensis TaxID=1347902 RepID=A0A917EQ71_9BACI|nr:GNAT family N-acetyltransferase [Priestia taiwanensis]MBM7363936.1 ribosomal protein S18 acetylase RimI-like enzyme [Priestia taiwanensis]GGE70303.1 N-acetyltransferase [Priestia taiwanensis]